MTTDSVGGMTKQRYAACLAAAVAHLALMQHDAVGLTLFSNVIQEHLPPRAKSNQLNEILNTLVRVPPRPHGESARILHEVAELMPRRGLVVLLSDLFYEPDELFSALDHLQFRGHDVLIFQILDPLERSLPVGGSVRFRELETGQRTDHAGRRDSARVPGRDRAMAGRPGRRLPAARVGPRSDDHRRAAGRRAAQLPGPACGALLRGRRGRRRLSDGV